MDEKRLKHIIKETFVKQFNLFGEPTVTKVRKQREKMSEREKEERRNAREIRKKVEADKKFNKYCDDNGITQQNLFSDDEIGECCNKAIRNVVEENGINIKPENKGKFTQTKERTGKTTTELLHSKNKTTKARANFAKMAKRGWKPLKKNK